MAHIDKLIVAALKNLPIKPLSTATQSEKKRYSELLSEGIAQAIGEELRERGLRGTRPAPHGVLDRSGAERRMSGGIGAKKVDVTGRPKNPVCFSESPSRASTSRMERRVTTKRT